MDAGIKFVQLRNFRSYRFLDLDTDYKYVIFVGENGAGKTNILESISLLSSTKGLRKASLSDFKNTGAIGEWRVSAELFANGYTSTLETYSLSGKRSGAIDGSTIKSLGEFEKNLWFLWVTPQMNDLLIGQSQIKRSFFDHLVTGIDAHHHFRLQYLKKLQKERLHILQNNYDKNWLDAIELKIAELFVKIFDKRMDFLRILQNTFEAHRSDFLRPKIVCSGAVEDILAAGTEERFFIKILDGLANSREKDIAFGITNFSVTRSNWQVFKNSETAENCSSGEQKAMLISLILAAVRIYKSLRKEPPILLLDDIMVHLDKNKREILIDELKTLDVQVFLTGTDSYFFSHFNDDFRLISVRNSICF